MTAAVAAILLDCSSFSGGFFGAPLRCILALAGAWGHVGRR
jgi:hypothetical protein